MLPSNRGRPGYGLSFKGRKQQGDRTHRRSAECTDPRTHEQLRGVAPVIDSGVVPETVEQAASECEEVKQHPESRKRTAGHGQTQRGP